MTVFTDVYLVPPAPTAEHLYGSATHDTWMKARASVPDVSEMDSVGISGVSIPMLPTAQRGLSLASYYVPNWVDWFYYRFYVLPETLNLGTLASAQTRVVRLWNAYLDRKTLDGIVVSGSDGITVDGLASGEWRALRIESYDVSVGESGPIVLASSVQWTFSDPDDVGFSEAATLQITGERITLIPYMAHDGISEQLEWKTDIINANGQESRRGIRSTPRQSLAYRCYVSTEDRQILELMLEKQAGAYGTPIWWERQVVGAVTAGATQLSINTDNTDIRVGGLLLLWDDNRNYEAVELSAIGSGLVTFSRPVTNSYTNATAAPVRVGYLESASIDRMHRDNNFAQMSFIMNEYSAVTPDTYTQHQGYDVLLDASAVVSSQSITIRMARSWNDNGIGVMKPYAEEDRSRTLDSQKWIKKGFAEKWQLRQWLFAREGQRVPFFVPTWQNDYILKAQAIAVATTLTIQPTGQTAPLDVRIELNDGTSFLRHIPTIFVETNGDETWTMDSSFGQIVNPSDIAKFSRLRLMRQASDEITIEHSMPHLTEITVPVTTL